MAHTLMQCIGWKTIGYSCRWSQFYWKLVWCQKESLLPHFGSLASVAQGNLNLFYYHPFNLKMIGHGSLVLASPESSRGDMILCQYFDDISNGLALLIDVKMQARSRRRLSLISKIRLCREWRKACIIGP